MQELILELAYQEDTACGVPLRVAMSPLLSKGGYQILPVPGSTLVSALVMDQLTDAEM